MKQEQEPEPMKQEPWPMKQESGPMKQEEGDVRYYIQKIVNKRVMNGVVEYRVRWQGYRAAEDTWEKAEKLVSCCYWVHELVI
jgi:Chromo (CHRromatin Organisation MOdifier) domain